MQYKVFKFELPILFYKISCQKKKKKMKSMRIMLPYDTLILENITKYDKYFGKVNIVSIFLKLTQLTSVNTYTYNLLLIFNTLYMWTIKILSELFSTTSVWGNSYHNFSRFNVNVYSCYQEILCSTFLWYLSWFALTKLHT